jgi:multimeric flavodoxin WrbA
MKICVLNGSPKGRQSVTMQYVRFLELAFPSHTFVIEDVGLRTGSLEAKEEEFKKVIASMESADAILFATPVYYLLVPAQFKRFIELLFSHNVRSALLGKYAASLTTSIHFFDHTANEYLHAVAEDLGMHWTGSFMAGMDDLLLEKNQENLLLFGQDFLDTAKQHPAIRRTYPPVSSNHPEYRSAGVPMPLDAKGKQVLILSDAAPGSNLEKMTTRLASCFGKSASLVPIDDAKMKGGCLGCCRCAFDNTCVYTDRFSEFWKETVLPADIIIFAGTVKDRYLSAAFKQVFDRSFFMGHIPSFAGKQVGFLIEGPVGQCSTLRRSCGPMLPIRAQILPVSYRTRPVSPWLLTSRSMPLLHDVSACP